MFVKNNKKQEVLRDCWFDFNKDSGVFIIEINDIMYTVTPRDFNSIVQTVYAFYNKVLHDKVMETITGFIQQGSNIEKLDPSPTPSALDNKTLKLFEDVLRGKDANNGDVSA